MIDQVRFQLVSFFRVNENHGKLEKLVFDPIFCRSVVSADFFPRSRIVSNFNQEDMIAQLKITIESLRG